MRNICAFFALFVASASLLSCQNHSTFHSDGVENDCSGMFETKYVGGKNSRDAKMTAEVSDKNAKAKECKILEVKIDNNTKCEIVGSDKIDNLSKVLSKNKDNRVILIVPENKVDELSVLTRNYFITKGIDIKKHIDSEVFNNLNFPYKGMRCQVDDKEYVMWTGDKKVILTIGKL